MIIVKDQAKIEVYVTRDGSLCIQSEDFVLGQDAKTCVQPDLLELFMERLTVVYNEAIETREAMKPQIDFDLGVDDEAPR